MWADTLLIVFISICTALLGEGLTWLMVYRTEKYQKLKAEVERQSKKCKYYGCFRSSLKVCGFSGKEERSPWGFFR